ncbi:MAG TPA: universal stress protein [Bacillota bacterium]|nr:universal stress protein [Bacillota bacterium]
MLLALDGSPLSESAFPVACRMTAPGVGRLVLVSAIDALDVGRMEPWARYAFGRHVEAVARDAQAAAGQAQAYLAQLAAGAGDLATDAIVRMGEAAHVITDVAAEVGADLIVMATHGRSGVARLAVGSVADAVLRMACAPVLLVGPGVHSRGALAAERAG